MILSAKSNRNDSRKKNRLHRIDNMTSAAVEERKVVWVGVKLEVIIGNRYNSCAVFCLTQHRESRPAINFPYGNEF